jgi:hypothetical protein
MKALITRILQSDCFEVQPPVLVDIGASGQLHDRWRLLAKYSVGIAFDADSRDFNADAKDPHWRKLHVFNRLLVPQGTAATTFHLTRSPHCSSALPIDAEGLRPWAFNALFEVERTVTLAAVDLPLVLRETGLSNIDWFKTDSQGTDLRLFRSLPNDIQTKVLAADFEPGIIDAYVGEDKLHQLMAYMGGLPFWVSGMTIRGSQRIGTLSQPHLSPLQRRYPGSFFKTSPGWCEISYLNRLEDEKPTERDLLLGIAFALIQGQDGFASELARRGQMRYSNALFGATLELTGRRARLGYLKLCKDRVINAYRRVL